MARGKCPLCPLPMLVTESANISQSCLHAAATNLGAKCCLCNGRRGTLLNNGCEVHFGDKYLFSWLFFFNIKKKKSNFRHSFPPLMGVLLAAFLFHPVPSLTFSPCPEKAGGGLPQEGAGSGVF